MRGRGRVLLVLASAVLLLFAAAAKDVQASEIEGGEEAEKSAIEEELLEQFDFREMDASLKKLFPGERLTFKDTLMAILSGDVKVSAELLNRLVADQFTYVVRSNKTNLIHILLLAMVAALFTNFSNVFQNKHISQVSFYMIYLLLLSLCLNSFGIVMDWVSEGVNNVTSFMGVFCPLYFLAVAIAKGSVTSIAFFNLVLFLVYVVELVIANFLLPVIHVYMMVKVLNFLSSEEYLSKLSDLLGVVIVWTLRTMLACVVGLNIVQGLISPAIDTVKRSALTRGVEAIPGVGDAIGGVTEVVFGTAVLIKNGIGMAGVLLCVALCVVPLIQVGIVVLMYKLAAALIQPISDKRIVGCVESVGEGCQILMRVIFTVGLLFLITIVIVCAVTGNV